MKLCSLIASALPLAIVAATSVACTATGSDPIVAEAVDATESSIIGGTEAVPGSWPGTVALYKGSTQACGGALVHPSWVVTAAHCVTTSSPTGGFAKIVINRHDLTTAEGESITPKRAFRHESYNSSTLDNDIALIELSTPSTAPLAKIVSPEQQATLLPTVPTWTVGWGRTSEGGASSKVLRQVDVPVIANDICKTYPRYNRVTDNQICAGYEQGGRDSCQGDSGTPLFYKIGKEIVQVGLTSWGIGCARPKAPGVYTKVANYLGWLTEKSGGAIVTATAPTTPTEPPTTPTEPPTTPTEPPTTPTTPVPAFTPFSAEGTVTRAQEKAFSFDAPAGTYVVELSGTGDADLYVNNGTPALTGDWDCRPYIAGSSEECEVTLAKPATVHVMVRGFSNAASNFTVTGKAKVAAQ